MMLTATRTTKTASASGRSRDLFTLIELLIVIAIIAILTAMLLPALKKSRDMAQTIKCVGNLKQMSLSCSLYAQDYSEYVLPDDIWLAAKRCAKVTYTGQQSDYYYQFMLLKLGYITGYKSFMCPSDPQSSTPKKAFERGYIYGVNYAAWYGTSDMDYRWASLRTVVKPATCAYVGDTRVAQTSSISHTDARAYDASKPQFRAFHPLMVYTEGHVFARHGGNKIGNMGFLDGHVTRTKIKIGKNPVQGFHQALRPAGRNNLCYYY